MQTKNRFFDDLARVAGGAASTLTGIKEEFEAMARQQVERLLTNMDLVQRDEFDAVRAMAARARSEQEKLEKRLAALEASIGAKVSPGKVAGKPKTSATAKPKPKTAPTKPKTTPKKSPK